MKKNIIEKFEKIQPNRYPNLDFENRTLQDSVNPALLYDLNLAAKNLSHRPKVSYAITGHKKGPNTRHDEGLAVDISSFGNKGWESESNAKSKGIYDTIIKFVENLKNLGYQHNQEVGTKKAVLSFNMSDNNHENHVHVSNKTTESSNQTQDMEKIDPKNYPNIVIRTELLGYNIPKKFLEDINMAAKNSGVNPTITSILNNNGTKLQISKFNGKYYDSVSDAKNLKIYDSIEKFVSEMESLGYGKNKEDDNFKNILTFGFPDNKYDNQIVVTYDGKDISSNEVEGGNIPKKSYSARQMVKDLVTPSLEKIGFTKNTNAQGYPSQSSDDGIDALQEEIKRIKKLLK